ncbi:hypothetical protein HUK65_14125 [Rhodobacteraceae bacterium 2376]|uniref:Molybdopterin molybdenumtransferase n=1 Tax=Rhabdonatronobacter sediminivivens TaxID=2743469 RepID=A0A7Z0I1B6_9RHOB|nr:hypothetical protein [Rhabdonatronobacter sediminivivens]NYS26127.1 hypothetical protein [Rhabdonatronobacter sediminivivens]
MSHLTPLETCLAQALDGIAPVAPEMVAPWEGCGHVLARDLVLPHDLPPAPEALCAGFAVAALDLVGASGGSPVALDAPQRVAPGAAMPPGTDAVLPEEGTDTPPGLIEAIRPVTPGEGIRRAGHDGRAGAILVAAGRRLAPRHGLIAARAGIDALPLRRPRVAVALEDAEQAGFARGWLATLGAVECEGAADLTLRPVQDHAPRLALAPAQTAWLSPADGTRGLVLEVPARFDAMVAALLGLALPALAHLGGAVPGAETRPLARKLTATVGLSELVLLAESDDGWLAQPAGLVTLSGLAAARGFAILPPESEGLPAGAALSATPLDLPFG